MMEAGYPNSLVAPLDIAIDGYDKPEVKAQTDALIRRLDEDGGFITAVPIEVNDTGDVAWKRVFLNQDPFTAEASDKVKQLRNEFIGDSFTQAGGEALVTGYGAFNDDFVAVTEQYMTPVLVFVLGLSFLLMLVAFRSILFAVVCTSSTCSPCTRPTGWWSSCSRTTMAWGLSADTGHRRLRPHLPALRSLRHLDGLLRLPAEPYPRALRRDGGHG